MNTIIQKNFSKIFYFFIFFLFFFYDEILIQDTGSYIENIYKRPFLYPFIINIFQLISETAFLKLLSIFQLILGYICLIYFSFFFIRKFNIKNILYQIILIFTVAYPYLGISMKLGLTIFSESIGYPLILLFSVIFIKNYFFLKEVKGKKYFFFMMILLALMVLNKKTFLIVLPVILLGEIYNLFINKKIKFFLINILIILTTLFLINITERANSYIKSGVFKPISVGGSSYVTAPFYLATDEDLEKITGDENRKIIQFALLNFKKDNIERNIISKSENDILNFSKNNRKIFSNYYSQYVYMQDLFENKISGHEFFGLDKKDELLARELSSKHCTQIAFQLIKLKPKENLIFYITNVIYGMGGYFISRDDLRGFYANIGFAGFFLLILQILVSFICVISLAKNTDKQLKSISCIILFFFVLNLINCLTTALFTPVYDRYSFYTFQMVFFSISLIFILFFDKKRT
tara:strand:- start:3942 stop:5333 length:1392 start_codon:yes stop_codon:yes gene_type:complete